jgi:uncharacterized protein Yka (UPF0111/DUF47 family)
MFELFQKDNEFFFFFKIISDRVLQGIKLLKDMMQGSGDMKEKARMIKGVEEVAHQIVYKAIDQLRKSKASIDYESTYTLVAQMDDILDYVDEISEIIIIHEIEGVFPEAMALIEVLEKSAEELAKGISTLRDSEQTYKIHDTCAEIKRLEVEGDSIFRKATASLFIDLQDKVEVIIWKDIYKNLERAIDRCENVAISLEKIVIDHS